MIIKEWTDYQLRWDEADYGGIAVLRLPPDKVCLMFFFFLYILLELLLSRCLKIHYYNHYHDS